MPWKPWYCACLSSSQPAHTSVAFGKFATEGPALITSHPQCLPPLFSSFCSLQVLICAASQRETAWGEREARPWVGTSQLKGFRKDSRKPGVLIGSLARQSESQGHCTKLKIPMIYLCCRSGTQKGHSLCAPQCLGPGLGD